MIEQTFYCDRCRKKEDALFFGRSYANFDTEPPEGWEFIRSPCTMGPDPTEELLCPKCSEKYWEEVRELNGEDE